MSWSTFRLLEYFYDLFGNIYQSMVQHLFVWEIKMDLVAFVCPGCYQRYNKTIQEGNKNDTLNCVVFLCCCLIVKYKMVQVSSKFHISTISKSKLIWWSMTWALTRSQQNAVVEGAFTITYEQEHSLTLNLKDIIITPTLTWWHGPLQPGEICLICTPW